jgi:hypothetical protein
MKKVKHLLLTFPELMLVALTMFYWVSSGTLVNPVAIALILVLTIQIILRNDFLGVVIPILVVMASIYLMLALFSEFSEFHVKNAEARRLILVGIPFILTTIASSVLMIRKYTKQK